MAGRLQFQFDFTNTGKAKRREGSRKRLLVLGDYTGQNPNPLELPSRKTQRVDVDELDTVLSRIAPQLRIMLDDGGEETLIEFRELEDFHPDSLYKRLPVFKTLRDLRGRLENPFTYEAAAEELKRGGGIETSVAEGVEPQAMQPNSDDANLLDRLLGNPVLTAGSKPIKQADAIQTLVRQLVEPHLPKGVDLSQQKQFLSAIDDAINQVMRKILHHPRFQALEAVWRGIDWLVGNIEDSEELQIFLLDASKEELAEDFNQSEGLGEKTAIYRLLTESSLAVPGGEPWSLVVGLYTFGEDVESLSLLELLGAVSERCGGYFLAAASAELLGCGSLALNPDASDWPAPQADIADDWQLLRKSPAARSIGLALPRFMLRRPYGKNSNPVENFRFEEMLPRPVHETYLWGNPALVCAGIIARGWLEGDDEPGTLRDTGTLPFHIYDDGSGQAIKPCAEVYLNEKTANVILGAGIIPVLSVRNQDRAIVPRLMTIAEPATEIAKSR